MTAEKRAAAFLLAATVGFAGLLVVSTLDDGWWRPEVEFIATIESGAGLSPGLPVTVSHLPVGRVEEIWLEPDRSVRVRLSVDERYAEHVRTDSVADAVMTTAGKSIEIGSGQGTPMQDGGQLQPGQNYDPLLALAELDLADTLMELKEAISDLNEVASSLGLRDTELPEMIALMRGLLEDIQEGSGTLGQLLSDPMLADQLSVTLKETAEASRALKESSENLDRTLDVLYTTSVEVGSGAEKINEGMPKVTSGAQELEKAMVEMRKTLDQVDKTLGEVDKAVDRLNSIPVNPLRREEDEGN